MSTFSAKNSEKRMLWSELGLYVLTKGKILKIDQNMGNNAFIQKMALKIALFTDYF
jgi:hypothetical protein